MADRIADTVTRGDVTRFIEKMAFGRGKETLRMARSVHQQLSSFYSWAIPKLDRLPAHPCRDAWRPKASKPRDRVLSDYELGQLWDASLGEGYHPSQDLVLVEPEGRRADLDAFFGQIPAAVRHSGSEAYYEPVADRITMPLAELFTGFGHYYATLAHELSHWTGHGSRLDRNLKNRFGSAAYAAEELIAELSSAILGAELGLPVAHLDNHASYIGNWLKLLRDDDRAILTAASRAEEASALLLVLGGREIEAEEAEPISEAA